MRRFHPLLGLTVLVALLASPALASANPGPFVRHQLARVKTANEKYRDVNVALAHGYQATQTCVEDPSLGAMGYHYYNPQLGDDPRLLKLYPEFLLYLPTDTGGLRLGGVEYYRPDADQDLSTDSDRPTLFRRHFNGPMYGHFPGQPIHFDLHVWLFMKNPAGVFARYNPAASC